MARNAALPILTAEPGLTHYLEEIRRFPMLERQEEYMLAKRWREHGDRDAAHKLVTSHLRFVTKIARDHRAYGLPISEAISEGKAKSPSSNQSNAISRWDDEGGASSAGDRSVRIHSSGIEQPVKGAVAPTHIEDCQSNSDVPGKGRFAVRGGVLRKKGR